MSLKETIQRKLEPHSERVIQGTNDEFDYLPATLFELIRQQEAASAESNNGINKLSQDAKITGDLFTQKLDESNHKVISLISELMKQQEAASAESNKKLRRANYLMLILLVVITGLLIFIVVKH